MGLSYAKFDEAAVAEALIGLPGWKLEGGHLVREFVFDSYKDGVVFAAALGWVADQLNHHPDMTIGYGKVRVATMTHDASGITSYDVELARRADRVYQGG